MPASSAAIRPPARDLCLLSVVFLLAATLPCVTSQSVESSFLSRKRVVNDGTSCALAIDINTQNITVNTTNAPDTGLGCMAGHGPGIWAVFNGTGNKFTISTCTTNTTFDTTLGVFEDTGCPAAGATCYAFDDDTTGQGTCSTSDFDTLLGKNYYVYVSGYNSALYGMVGITLYEHPPVFINPITAPGASCENATLLSFPSSQNISTTNYPATGFGCSRDSGRGQWVKFLGNDTVARVSTCNPATNFDTNIGVWKGQVCPASTDSCFTGNEDIGGGLYCSQVDFWAAKDEWYFLYIGGYNYLQYGNAELSVKDPTPTFNCPNKIDVNMTSTTLFDTISLLWSGISCTNARGRGQWLSFVGNGSTYNVSTCNNGTTFDTFLAVWDSPNCPNPNPQQQCGWSNDNVDGQSTCSFLQVPTLSGRRYWVHVTGSSFNDAGTVNFTVDVVPGTVTPIPPSAPVPPESAPQTPPQAAPQSSPQAVPQSAPLFAPQSTPQAAPRAAPQSAPLGSPTMAPDQASVSQPQTSPVGSPQSAPESVLSQPAQAAPVAEPQAVSDPAPSMTPQEIPQSAPSNAPEQAPQTSPSSSPQTATATTAPISLPQTVGTVFLQFTLVGTVPPTLNTVEQLCTVIRTVLGVSLADVSCLYTSAKRSAASQYIVSAYFNSPRGEAAAAQLQQSTTLQNSISTSAQNTMGSDYSIGMQVVPIPSSESGSGPSTAQIAGGVVGGLVGVVLIAVIIAFVYSRRKRSEESDALQAAQPWAASEESDIEMQSPHPSKPSPPSAARIAASFEDQDNVDNAAEDTVAVEAQFNLSDFKPEWLIPFTEIEIERKLGSGAFGIVYHGHYNDSEVAIKQTNLSVGQSSLDEFKREAILLLSMKPHPSIVQVLGISVSESNIYMIMEYCQYGSLDVYMQRYPLSNEDKERILDSVASGVAHLHRNRIVHRDLAARNILLAGDLKAKVADTFGMSRIVDKFEQKGTTGASMGPVKYMAPESLSVNKEYSAASDAWTFGIVCVEVWSGKSPHAHKDMLESAIAIRDHGETPEVPADMPDWMRDVVTRCWAFNPKDRISMSEVTKIFRRHRRQSTSAAAPRSQNVSLQSQSGATISSQSSEPKSNVSLDV